MKNYELEKQGILADLLGLSVIGCGVGGTRSANGNRLFRATTEYKEGRWGNAEYWVGMS
jgi:hypothetical protein